MTTLTYVILFSILGGVVSLTGAILLLGRKKLATRFAYYATPFAAGALLAAVFLDLLKEGFEQSNTDTVLFATLIGILSFFFAERFLRWFHHHHQHETTDPAVPLIVAGDTIHNALDGVVIAAAFLISIPTGIVTTLAVAAHEIPQEIGDFGLLLKKGVSRKSVLIINILSAVATVAAAVATYLLGDADKLPIGFLLGLSAGFLLYIALSDIIPLLHEDTDHRRILDSQSILLVVGLLVVAGSISLAHKYIEHDETHNSTHTHSYIHEYSRK